MKTGFVISAGVHAVAIVTVLIGTWNTTYSRMASPKISGYRQVSVISASDLPGRMRPMRPNPNKRVQPAKTDTKQPEIKKQSASNESKSSTGGTGDTHTSGISTGLTTDEAFPHGYYLELVEKKIEAMFSPPIRTPGLETDLHFVLERTGRATEIKVQKSSGNAMFDQAAMRAVLSANPLPPLPGDFGASTLGILYIFKSN